MWMVVTTAVWIDARRKRFPSSHPQAAYHILPWPSLDSIIAYEVKFASLEVIERKRSSTRLLGGMSGEWPKEEPSRAERKGRIQMLPVRFDHMEAFSTTWRWSSEDGRNHGSNSKGPCGPVCRLARAMSRSSFFGFGRATKH